MFAAIYNLSLLYRLNVNPLAITFVTEIIN